VFYSNNEKCGMIKHVIEDSSSPPPTINKFWWFVKWFVISINNDVDIYFYKIRHVSRITFVIFPKHLSSHPEIWWCWCCSICFLCSSLSIIICLFSFYCLSRSDCPFGILVYFVLLIEQHQHHQISGCELRCFGRAR
jgi:hypothetical protein